MTGERLEHQRLRSFFAHHGAAAGESLESDFTWPLELVPLKFALGSYHWTQIQGRTGKPLLGIRSLGFRPPFRLADLGLRIFRAELTAGSEAALGHEELECYLIVELAVSLVARAYLTLVLPMREWYVLDEHQFARDALKAL